MKVIAPGKVLLTGAYAVLEGAPAIVMAVDRHVVADPSRCANQPTREVLFALSTSEAPEVETEALLWSGGEKLGLGSSAAVLVASLGAKLAAEGADLRDSAVRRVIFEQARAAHASAQSGGSGVDVAASVYGGVLRYALPKSGPAVIDPVELPSALHVAVFWTGVSARTPELRAKVESLRVRAPALYEACLGSLTEVACAASRAVDGGDAPAFISAARAAEDALSTLGVAADAPIVLPKVAELARAAHDEGASFCPGGAGGGDVTVYLGTAPPSDKFLSAARAAKVERVPICPDQGGVRIDNRLSKDRSS
jgi:phosphomevalonate kinase